MLETFRKLNQSLVAKKPLAYCRLIETRGSTPQKAGAVMLVYEDGSQDGTLGGGCVEAEVKRQALTCLANGKTELTQFQLDNDYGWDDGLICGGRMMILIEPLSNLTSVAYYQRLVELAESSEGATEAIVFDEKSELPVPSALLFDAAGDLDRMLYLTDQSAADAVKSSLRPLEIRPRPYIENGVSFLPILSRCQLLVVGAGHVGQAVANMASELDFDVTLVDDRQEFLTTQRVPHAKNRICGPIEETLAQFPVTPNTYCLIVTRGHNHDERALYHLADRGARYVGLIGSRRKIRMIMDDLMAEGLSADVLKTVYAPVGIDIGSQTVAEIAVSIVAELVSHRNRDGVVPGRPNSVMREPTS